MQDQDKYAEQAASIEDPVTAEAASATTPTLEEQLAASQLLVQELQDSFLRAKAEVENFRRRAQEDVTRAHKFAIEGFAEMLLPVKDSLEMALQVETPSIESPLSALTI